MPLFVYCVKLEININLAKRRRKKNTKNKLSHFVLNFCKPINNLLLYFLANCKTLGEKKGVFIVKFIGTETKINVIVKIVRSKSIAHTKRGGSRFYSLLLHKSLSFLF